MADRLIHRGELNCSRRVFGTAWLVRECWRWHLAHLPHDSSFEDLSIYISQDPLSSPRPPGFLAGIVCEIYLSQLGWQESINLKVYLLLTGCRHFGLCRGSHSIKQDPPPYPNLFFL